MANFVSTTASSYSDPLKAQSIKALEARYKDMMAQQAQGGGITPENTQTPIQGFGHLANQLGDSFQMARVDQAAAAQKDELAKLIAADPTSANPQTQARLAVIAPDMYKDVVQQLAERRRQQDLFAQQDKSQGALFGHQDAAAKEAARVAEIARGQEDTAIRARDAQKALDDQAAAREQQKVTREGQAPDLVKMQRSLAAGEIDQKTFDAYVKKQTSPSAAETEHMVTRQKESVEQQSTLDTLDQALGYLDHPDGIFAGKNADWRTGISGRLPEKLTGLNEKTRENTASFNKIMGAQALAQLTQMKGASSDKDVKINFDIANDPNATIDEKKRAIGVLKKKLIYWTKINNDAIAAAGGTVPQLPDGGGAAGGAAPHPEEGRTYSSPGKPTLIRRNGKLEPL